MDMHWATVWEHIADTIPEAAAITNGTVTATWRQYDQRAARLATALSEAGLGPGSKVGLYLYNGNEYLEAQYAAFKMRAVPVNINYRYLDDELWYLLDNSDAEALVYHRSLAHTVGGVLDRLPQIKILIEVDDGGEPLGAPARAYDEVIGSCAPMERIERPEDDLYMLYTGGTTGMPKGVMYDIGLHTRSFGQLIFPAIGMPGADTIDEVITLVDQLHQEGRPTVSTTAAPLMHGTGLWLGALMHLLAGGHVITTTSRSLDAHEMLTIIAQHRVTHTTIVGDTFAKPIIRAIDEAARGGTPYDTTSLQMINSSGVMWTAEVKAALLERIPQAILFDAMGSSEGSMGSQITTSDNPTETAQFISNPTTKVFKEDDTEVAPGSDEIGMVAAGGLVPIGYYKDESKSAATFRTIDGVRYSFPGDLAQVAADGTLILLGRGSGVINSGGEKIYPEEVEEAVKRADGVVDCLVVGIDDDTFGQAVTAVASRAPDATVDEAEVIDAVKHQLARYKAPKRIVWVAQVPRAPNGKADYRAARALAIDALTS